LIGDPGSGKSMLLKRINIVAPKSRYVSGKGASGAGLTAAVVKDEFLQGWSLEAGALVLANKGMCMIDEMDKMSKEDTSAMHEALEQQTVSISKANIQATLVCETTVLAAANPKHGRFDPSGIIAEQIEMSPTLLSRFDLIFPIKDIPDEIKDEKFATFVLELHHSSTGIVPEIETKQLRKYLIYAKKLIPKLTPQAIEELKGYYVKMRSAGAEVEAGMKSVAITPRQLEALVRLAEAYAKLHLSDKVTKRDAKKSIELMDYCLRQIGLDPKTGKIDIDKIYVGITASQRGKMHVITEIIDDLIKTSQGKSIEVSEIEKIAASKNISEKDVTETLESLKKSGEIFEPKRGFISKI
jgi:replicative DNA helicase Mcm